MMERMRGRDILVLFCDSILKRLSADSASVAMAFSLTIFRKSLIPAVSNGGREGGRRKTAGDGEVVEGEGERVRERGKEKRRMKRREDEKRS